MSKHSSRWQQELSFSRAAAKLRMGQPAVSRLVRSLEPELEVVLRDRTTQRVSRSHVGRAFLPAAKAVVAQVDVAARAAREASCSHHPCSASATGRALRTAGRAPRLPAGNPACFR